MQMGIGTRTALRVCQTVHPVRSSQCSETRMRTRTQPWRPLPSSGSVTITTRHDVSKTTIRTGRTREYTRQRGDALSPSTRSGRYRGRIYKCSLRGRNFVCPLGGVITWHHAPERPSFSQQLRALFAFFRCC